MSLNPALNATICLYFPSLKVLPFHRWESKAQLGQMVPAWASPERSWEGNPRVWEAKTSGYNIVSRRPGMSKVLSQTDLSSNLD